MWVYKITNIINSKIYIGLTSNSIENRFEQHKKAANRIKIAQKVSYLYTAMKKYGVDNFIIEQVKECSSKKDLYEQEIYYINLYNSKNPKIGYNIANGGSGGDCTSSHPNKKDIYERAGKNKTGEKNGFYGKHHTEETKKILSKAHTGKKLTEEHKKKMSVAQKGREITWGDKISKAKIGAGNAMFGKHHTEEHNKRVSEKLKASWAIRKAKKNAILLPTNKSN